MLDVPLGQSLHESSGVGLPFVPAGQAVNPEGAVASILDPSGTTTEEDPPLATIDPAFTGSHVDCSGSGCKYPAGQSWHAALLLEPTFGFFLPATQWLHSSGLVTPVTDEYRPCGHPIQALLATAPISVEYNPAGHSVVCFNIEDEENPINEFHTKSNHKTDQQITFHKNNINKT